MNAEVQRLVLRLALLRQRIDQRYLLVDTMPIAHPQPNEDAFAKRMLVTRDTHPTWEGESVVVWIQRDCSAGWAVQLACPHAAISLAESDIEDLRVEFPSTAGPCIACPAHMYVFDLGSGACLTDEQTASARVYDVEITRHGETCAVWVARQPQSEVDGTRPARPVLQGGSEAKKPGALVLHNANAPRGKDSSSACAGSRAVGNAIQLRLVEKGLKRRFGNFDDD